MEYDPAEITFNHSPEEIAELEALTRRREAIMSQLTALVERQTPFSYADHGIEGGLAQELRNNANRHIELRTGSDGAFHPYVPQAKP